MSKARPLLAITLIFCMAVPSVGCRRIREKIQERDVERGTTTFKTDDGTTVTIGSNAKIPEGFPTDVPMYPGARVYESSGGAQDGTFTVRLTSNDGYEQVRDFYRSKIPASVDPLTFGPLIAYDDGTRSISVAVNPAVADKRKGRTDIELKITPPKAKLPLPEGFPADVPLYPGANVEDPSNHSLHKGGISVRLITNDSVQQVKEFYLSQVPAGSKSTPNASNSVEYDTEKHSISVHIGTNPRDMGLGRTNILLFVLPIPEDLQKTKAAARKKK